MTIEHVDLVGRCVAFLGLLLALGGVLIRMKVLSWTRPLPETEEKAKNEGEAATSASAERAKARVRSAAARGFMESAEEQRLRSFLEEAVSTRKEAPEPKDRLEGLRARASAARRMIGMGLLEAEEAPEASLLQGAELTEALGSVRATARVGMRRRMDLSEVALSDPIFSPEGVADPEPERAPAEAVVARSSFDALTDLEEAEASADESSAAWVSFESATKNEASGSTAVATEDSSERRGETHASGTHAPAEPIDPAALALTGIDASGVAVSGSLPRLVEGAQLAILAGDAGSCSEEIEELWLEAQFLHSKPDRERAAHMAAELRRLADTYLLLAHAPESVPQELLLPSHTEIAA